jgi:hypothetical protein
LVNGVIDTTYHKIGDLKVELQGEYIRIYMQKALTRISFFLSLFIYNRKKHRPRHFIIKLPYIQYTDIQYTKK